MAKQAKQAELYSIEILVDGEVIPTYHKKKASFIEAFLNKDYTIRVKNDSYLPIEVVLSVDGLSVMSGESASIEERGYVVPGQSRIDIPGWRRGNDKVASFSFASPEKSYSAKMGKDTSNIGVIGCAIFMQKFIMTQPLINPNPWYDNPYPGWPWYDNRYHWYTITTTTGIDVSSNTVTTRSANMSKASDNINIYSNTEIDNEPGVNICASAIDDEPKQSFDVGTAYGKEVNHATQNTTFDRAFEEPDQVISLFYKTKAVLIDEGIIKPAKPAKAKSPEPFPGTPAPFAPAPSDWSPSLKDKNV